MRMDLHFITLLLLISCSSIHVYFFLPGSIKEEGRGKGGMEGREGKGEGEGRGEIGKLTHGSINTHLLDIWSVVQVLAKYSPAVW